MSEILKLPSMFDEAILGVVERCGKEPYIVYSEEKLIEILESQGMDHEEAVEYFEFNMAGAWMGEGTPGFVSDLERWQINRQLDS